MCAGIDEVGIESLEGNKTNLQVIGITLDEPQHRGTTGNFTHLEKVFMSPNKSE
jgi:hypothetical protein